MNRTARTPEYEDLVVVGPVRAFGKERTIMEGSFSGPAGEATGSIPKGSTGNRQRVQRRHLPYNKVGCWLRLLAAASVLTGSRASVNRRTRWRSGGRCGN